MPFRLTLRLLIPFHLNTAVPRKEVHAQIVSCADCTRPAKMKKTVVAVPDLVRTQHDTLLTVLFSPANQSMSTTHKRLRSVSSISRSVPPVLNVKRPTLEEYWASPAGKESHGVIELTVAREDVGAGHLGEGRVESCIWGSLTRAEAEFVAATSNDLCYRVDQERARTLVYLAIPAPPCVIASVDGTHTLEIPASMPLASNSLRVGELLTEMTDFRGPDTTKAVLRLGSVATTLIEKAVAKAFPKQSARSNASLTAELLAWAVQHEKPAEVESTLAEFFDTTVVPLVQSYTDDIRNLWHEYNRDKSVLKQILTKLQKADFELPLEMIGSETFWVCPPGEECVRHRFLVSAKDAARTRTELRNKILEISAASLSAAAAAAAAASAAVVEKDNADDADGDAIMQDSIDFDD